jgi:hypothetical protein
MDNSFSSQKLAKIFNNKSKEEKQEVLNDTIKQLRNKKPKNLEISIEPLELMNKEQLKQEQIILKEYITFSSKRMAMINLLLNADEFQENDKEKQDNEDLNFEESLDKVVEDFKNTFPELNE